MYNIIIIRFNSYKKKTKNIIKTLKFSFNFLYISKLIFEFFNLRKWKRIFSLYFIKLYNYYYKQDDKSNTK